MPQRYAFTTHWQIKAPLQDVWQAIYHSLEWPEWWKGVEAVKAISEGDEEGIGGVREYTWRSILPYRLTFRMRLVAIQPYQYLKGEAFGELEGTGEWFFEERKGITYVQYNWTVVTNKAWMNGMAFLLKPLFRYNHNVVMRWGAEGLAKKLGAELVSV